MNIEEMEINLREIGMPEDVIFETGSETIPLKGNLTGDPSEIIVITQFRRMLYSGTVCHIEKGNTNQDAYVIRDMPGFNEIHMPYGFQNRIHEFDGIKYTMACLAEKNDYALANWIY